MKHFYWPCSPIAEEPKGRAKLRHRVHQRGADADADQRGGGAHHQPGRVQGLQLLQHSVREAGGSEPLNVFNRPWLNYII